MILHLLRMRRNVNRNVFNDQKNVSATFYLGAQCAKPKGVNVEFYPWNFMFFKIIVYVIIQCTTMIIICR